ncbi:S41 family peptidase [Myroides odoratimimus]|uniref:S41 family peptidase n=1 Tax=Myroides odoratimimus TaxID=76832 RepID=UPI0031014D18
MVKIRYIMVITFLFLQFFAFGQKKVKDFTKENYLADFDFVVKAIKEQHPNPFRFITEKEFDKKVKELRHTLEQKPIIENFILCNPVALIRDAHSGIEMDDIIYEDYVKMSHFFPVATSVYDNRVFVNQYTLDIPMGAEITKVNNVSTADLLNKIPNKVDGGVEASSNKNFSNYASLMFPEVQEYTIEYKETVEAAPKTITLKAVNYNDYEYHAQKSVLPLSTVAFAKGIYGYPLNDDTYILKITTFSVSEAYAYYILNNVFQDIKDKKIKKLVVDIRDNGGGLLSNIPLFYSFISPEKSFKNIYKYATRVPKVNIKENLLDENGKLANTADIISQDNFMSQRFDYNEEDQFYYGNSRLDDSYVENYPQDKNAFTGKVILLANNNTVSAAAYFAHLFKLNKRGDIVGQETRSCSDFTTAAWFLSYKLPNTESVLSLPRSEVFFNAIANKDRTCRGVLPNHTIKADDFQKGLQQAQDAEMNLALELLKR